MEQFLFGLYALIACGGALAVVLSQNVVRMAFYLVLSLGAAAGLFFLLDADFIGATQLLIYVGGTVVLLIFGVMLTASTPFMAIKSSPAEILQGGVVGFAFLALVISTLLSVDWEQVEHRLAGTAAAASHEHTEAPAALRHEAAPDSHAAADISSGYNPEGQGNTSRSIGTALLGVRFDKDLSLKAKTDHGHAHSHEHGDEPGHIHGSAAEHSHAEPVTLSTGYLLPFEIISVHLLVVLVGAAYLARAKRQNPASAM
jgi:NADH:ubiquinone oxidoreductase subunit 6 (subunit J)